MINIKFTQFQWLENDLQEDLEGYRDTKALLYFL